MLTPKIIETPVFEARSDVWSSGQSSSSSSTAHLRSHLRSPIRARSTDELLRDLSPTTTLQALNNVTTKGALRRSIDTASPAQRAFAIRAAEVSKNVLEWLRELSNWKWPAGSAGFEPSNHDEIGATDLSNSNDQYWGSLLVEQVLQYEARLDEISQDLESLDMEDLKINFLENHFIQRPSSGSYSRLDDLTTVITATVLHTLPVLAKLNKLMRTWTLRLTILREVPALLGAMGDAELELKSAWELIEDAKNRIPEKQLRDHKTQYSLSRSIFEAAKQRLSYKIVPLAQKVDFMLDSLEGQVDTVPESWPERMDAIEQSHAEWVATGELEVFVGERYVQERSCAEDYNAQHFEDGTRRDYGFYPNPLRTSTRRSILSLTNSQLPSGRPDFSVPGDANSLDSEDTLIFKDSTIQKEVESILTKEPHAKTFPDSQVDGPAISTVTDEVDMVDVSNSSVLRPSTPVQAIPSSDFFYMQARTPLSTTEKHKNRFSSTVLPIGAMMSAIASIPLRADTPDATHVNDSKVHDTPPRRSSSIDNIDNALRSPSNQPQADRFVEDGGSPRSPHKLNRRRLISPEIRALSPSPFSTPILQPADFSSSRLDGHGTEAGRSKQSPLREVNVFGSTEDRTMAAETLFQVPLADPHKSSKRSSGISTASVYQVPLIPSPDLRELSYTDPFSTPTGSSYRAHLPGINSRGFTDRDTNSRAKEGDLDPIVHDTNLLSTSKDVSTSKSTSSKVQQQIDSILADLPDRIKLSESFKNEHSIIHSSTNTPTQLSVNKRRAGESRSRPSSRAATPTPSFTLSPAYTATKARPKHNSCNSEVHQYNLSRSADEAPVKLLLRLVGDHERVMVRVGGGWADLGEYLKEYATHHGTSMASKVEVQRSITPSRRMSGASISSKGSPLPLRPGSSAGAEQPLSSLGPSTPHRSRRERNLLQNVPDVRPNTPHAFTPSKTTNPYTSSKQSPEYMSFKPDGTRHHSRPSSRLSLGDNIAIRGMENPDHVNLRHEMSATSSPRQTVSSRSASTSSRPGSRAYSSSPHGELGLAGPKGRTVSISKDKSDWIESMKEKIFTASTEKEKGDKNEDFGSIGRAGATKRLFLKNLH